MQQPSGSGQEELQTAKRGVIISYFVLFASVGIYWMVLEVLRPGTEANDLSVIKPVFLVLAGACAGTVLYLRLFRIPPLIENPVEEVTRPIPKLRVYYILCFALCESVALFGFLLRFLGASRAEAGLYFVAAVSLLLVCYPRWPEALRS